MSVPLSVLYFAVYGFLILPKYVRNLALDPVRIIVSVKRWKNRRL